jgi:hypothetical protein
MRAFEFLTEYESRKGLRHKKYRYGGKPDWYEEAVKLKTDNPYMTAAEIGRQLNPPIHGVTILAWLTGTQSQVDYIVNDNPLFTRKDFPVYRGRQKYFDGAKPWWYEEAVAMRKQGMTYPAIANKLSTPEKKVTNNSIRDSSPGPADISNWLTKGRRHTRTGKLINPDAQFEPKWVQTKKIDTTEIEKLIDAGVDDADIIKYIRDEKGGKIAGQVRAMLPQLKQKLNPGTSVIDKTRTGNSKDPDISGFLKENFSD